MKHPPEDSSVVSKATWRAMLCRLQPATSYGWGPPSTLQVTSHHSFPGAEHRTTEFNTCFAGVLSCFGCMPFCPLCLSLFWNGNVYPMPLRVRSVELLFNFYRGSKSEFALSLRGNFGLFSNARTVMTLVTPRDGQ